MVNDHTRSAENWKCVWYLLRLYIYIRVYVDSHSLGQLALASKRTASIELLFVLLDPSLIAVFVVNILQFEHLKNILRVLFGFDNKRRSNFRLAEVDIFVTHTLLHEFFQKLHFCLCSSAPTHDVLSRIIRRMSVQTGMVTIYVKQIPNQPIVFKVW